MAYLGDPVQTKWYSTVSQTMALGGKAGTDWRQSMIDNNWEARPVDGSKEAEDAEETPEVIVEGQKRRDAESFAAKLQSAKIGASMENPEYLAYSRMDAAAMLTRIAKDKPGLLQALQDAIIAKDLTAFVKALEDQKGAKPREIADLKAALKKKDTDGFAEVLRGIAMPELQKLANQYAADHEEHWGVEVAGPTDPLMGNERRCKADMWVTCYDQNRYSNGDMLGVEPVVHGRPKQLANISYATISLGYDHDKWEEDTLYHPYVLDTVNAQSDLCMEANGFARLDGRIIGDRFEAGGAEAAAFWGNPTAQG
jgi:hypothetical protein